MGFPVNNPIDLRQVAMPSSPAAGTTVLYSKSDGLLYTRINSGYEITMMGVITTQYTSNAAPTPTGLAYRNICLVLAQAATATFGAPTSPSDGNTLFFRIKDDGSARSLLWNAVYRALDAVNMPLPATTIAGKWLYLGFVYNGGDAKWDLIAIVNQS